MSRSLVKFESVALCFPSILSDFPFHTCRTSKSFLKVNPRRPKILAPKRPALSRLFAAFWRFGWSLRCGLSSMQAVGHWSPRFANSVVGRDEACCFHGRQQLHRGLSWINVELAIEKTSNCFLSRWLFRHVEDYLRTS